jgi:hypothetical protein
MGDLQHTVGIYADLNERRDKRQQGKVNVKQSDAMHAQTQQQCQHEGSMSST